MNEKINRTYWLSGRPVMWDDLQLKGCYPVFPCVRAKGMGTGFCPMFETYDEALQFGDGAPVMKVEWKESK